MTIYVDDLKNTGAPWSGGMSCHMISDESTDVLVEFARIFLKMPASWIHRGSCDHFDLSPRLRARAIAADAVPLTGLAYSSKYWIAVASRLRREGKDPAKALEMSESRAAAAAARAAGA